MIIWDDQKRTNFDPAPVEFQDDCVCDLLIAGGHIVQGDDHEIPGRSTGCHKGQEIRCRNGTHRAIFGLDAVLNKAKGGRRIDRFSIVRLF
jgi:hypothetical protein